MNSIHNQLYFCHPCQKTIEINSPQLECPLCGSDFLQEAKMPELENESDPFSLSPRSIFRFNPENRHDAPNLFRLAHEENESQLDHIRHVHEMFRNLLANLHAQRHSDSEDEEEEIQITNSVIEEDEDLENNCKICLGNFFKGEEKASLACNHHYHTQCLEPWLNIKQCCPFCKQRL